VFHSFPPFLRRGCSPRWPVPPISARSSHTRIAASAAAVSVCPTTLARSGFPRLRLVVVTIDGLNW
jgi:hypothetical protein